MVGINGWLPERWRIRCALSIKCSCTTVWGRSASARCAATQSGPPGWHVPRRLGVASIQDLAKARLALQQAGSLAGESDHGNSLSLYAKDPDGVEIEVFWTLPREEWEKRGFGTRRLDLAGELALRAN
jgi:hypothetical protein